MEPYKTYEGVIKKIKAGFDIGTIIFQGAHETGMFSHYKHEDLSILAPAYFIDIIKSDLCRKYGVPSFDPEGYFLFMGIKIIPGPFEKVIIYHVNYPLYKREDMYYAFDLTLLVE